MEENKDTPEKLHEKTPQWFKDWHEGSFWHFKYHVESKLRNHGRLLWIIIACFIAASLIDRFA